MVHLRHGLEPSTRELRVIGQPAGAGTPSCRFRGAILGDGGTSQGARRRQLANAEAKTMTRDGVSTLFLVAMLMSLPAVAQDTPGRTCSNADIEGDWGTTMTGTIINPATGVAASFAAVNRATYDSEGNYRGTQTRSTNGTVSRVTFEGTYELSSDCTGTKTTRSYDPSGNLTNTVTQDFVLVDDAKELTEIMTSNILANGTNVPVVITGNSKKLFPRGRP
jgi:hypothetical protein